MKTKDFRYKYVCTPGRGTGTMANLSRHLNECEKCRTKMDPELVEKAKDFWQKTHPQGIFGVKMAKKTPTPPIPFKKAPITPPIVPTPPILPKTPPQIKPETTSQLPPVLTEEERVEELDKALVATPAFKSMADKLSYIESIKKEMDELRNDLPNQISQSIQTVMQQQMDKMMATTMPPVKEPTDAVPPIDLLPNQPITPLEKVDSPPPPIDSSKVGTHIETKVDASEFPSGLPKNVTPDPVIQPAISPNSSVNPQPSQTPQNSPPISSGTPQPSQPPANPQLDTPEQLAELKNFVAKEEARMTGQPATSEPPLGGGALAVGQGIIKEVSGLAGGIRGIINAVKGNVGQQPTASPEMKSFELGLGYSERIISMMQTADKNATDRLVGIFSLFKGKPMERLVDGLQSGEAKMSPTTLKAETIPPPTPPSTPQGPHAIPEVG